MSTPGSLAGLQTFEDLNITYERAYGHNPFKIACIKTAIPLLPPHSRVLDIGCGTGIPVSEMLSSAGLQVVGTDISPKMVEYAKARVKGGEFTVCDMLTYDPGERKFAGVFIIFSHLQLSYADFWRASWKFARTLDEEGVLVIGTMPGDSYVKEEKDWDETRTWVEDYMAPFMGEMIPSLMLSVKGQREFLESMGLEIVSETVDWFQPNDERCTPEEQQYIIARRRKGVELREPRPAPKGRSG